MSYSFKQYNYGTVAGVSMRAAGCGPTALADIIYNVDKTIAPNKVAAWMANRGYFSSAGSTRSGITAALKNYRMQCLYFTPEHTGGTEWRDAMELLKASREAFVWAIALTVGTVNGGKDNYWTSGGHFIAITDYDPKTGKIYVRDPAGRRDGYQDAERLKYDANCIWIITKAY